MPETTNIINPFVNRSMIKNPEDFLGRKREVKYITDRLAKMQCSSVVGERRIGKSSLLYYIHKTCEKPLGDEYKIIYLDLQSARMHTPPVFLSEILKGFDVDADIIKEDSPLLINLSKFEDAIEKLNEKINPVVCLDEFENITKRTNDFTDDFFESLRSLGNSSKIAYVTASKTSLTKLCRDGKLTSAFYNIFASIKLGGFSDDEAREFVHSDRSPVNFNDDEIEFILNLGKNHPLYLEIACWHVLESKINDEFDEKKITEDFNEEIKSFEGEVPEETTQEEQKVVKIPERAKYILSSQEIKIIRLLARMEYSVEQMGGLTEIRHRDIVNRTKFLKSAVTSYLHRLEERGLIQREKEEDIKGGNIKLKEWVKTVVGDSEWDERWMRIILALREEDKLNCKELSKRTRIGRGALHRVLDTLEDEKKIIQGYRHGISTIYELWPHYKK